MDNWHPLKPFGTLWKVQLYFSDVRCNVPMQPCIPGIRSSVTCLLQGSECMITFQDNHRIAILPEQPKNGGVVEVVSKVTWREVNVAFGFLLHSHDPFCRKYQQSWALKLRKKMTSSWSRLQIKSPSKRKKIVHFWFCQYGSRICPLVS